MAEITQDNEREWGGPADAPDFRSELVSLINRHSRENGSGTPDFILRDFICDALAAFDKAVNRRTSWYRPNPS